MILPQEVMQSVRLKYMRRARSKLVSYFWSILPGVREPRIARAITKRDSRRALRLTRVF
jgi:hypothetical protein